MTDVQAFIIWWLTIEALGIGVWPLVKKLFKSFPDQGWGFSKIFGILLVSYSAWLLGMLRLVPFTRIALFIIWAIISLICWFPVIKDRKQLKSLLPSLPLLVVEELLFFAALAFWSWVRAHNPEIRGLEKYMDYGFVLSILRARFFPPLDHFLAGGAINYYYFGHLICAILTKLSSVPPNITYNLQIANLFALTVLESFVIGFALFSSVKTSPDQEPKKETSFFVSWGSLFSGLLASCFTAVIGNLHYIVSRLQKVENYWYPTATRLIPYTIDEFPIYSFIVADLHGHVSDLPIVLLFLGLVLTSILSKKLPLFTQEQKKGKGKKKKILATYLQVLPTLIPLSLCLGTMYATNSWDFAIYLAFLGLVFFYFAQKKSEWWLPAILESFKFWLPILLLSVIFFLPFFITVKPIGKGIGLVHTWSPINLVLVLWGFYLFLSFVFLFWLFRKKTKGLFKKETIVRFFAKILGVKVNIEQSRSIPQAETYFLSDTSALLFILMGLFLLLLPEVLYVKDIYTPAYFRANTMFKLYYQAWVLLALATSYSVVRVMDWLLQTHRRHLFTLYAIVFIVLFYSVFSYTVVAIQQNTGNLQKFWGLDGTSYLERLFPEDAKAVDWLNQNVSGQPVIVEAVGESYTDYARISSNTGLPAVLGWPVHEWLWRGSYDEAGKRTAEVKEFYETEDLEKARDFIKRYQAKYIHLGGMEREKYPDLKEEKFDGLGKVIFESGNTKIIEVQVD